MKPTFDMLLNRFTKSIDAIGRRIDKELDDPDNWTLIERTSDLDAFAFKGCYWIATNTPLSVLQHKLDRSRFRLTKPPCRSGFIRQDGENLYIVYNGTRANVASRLKEHLFNEGHANTKKLGFEIDSDEDFSLYEWQVFAWEVNDTLLRYAIESWWRHNVGWPIFCKRG